MNKDDMNKKVYKVVAILIPIVVAIIIWFPKKEKQVEEPVAQNIQTVTQINEKEEVEPQDEVVEAEVDQTTEESVQEELPVIDHKYVFRNDKLLTEHFEKHGAEMGFSTKEEYEMIASTVIDHPDVLTKIEAEDGDMVYYLESENYCVVESPDGYIRTFFEPSDGKAYFDRQ